MTGVAEQLVYVSGGELGLHRERGGRGFVVLDVAGDRVTDAETLERVRALRIPPAWRDVWIATEANAHLQATGLDSRDRRQYLYHPLWRQRRDEEKFDDMLEFAERLPAVRATARALLSETRPDRKRTLALAVRLLDVGLFRIGWDRYARDNGHVGLTTLRRDQVTLHPTEVHFDYIAKSGKRRRLAVRDAQAVQALRALKRRRGLPEELLVYQLHRDWHRIHAGDVNNALRAWADGPYSAKEFRTWAATVIAAVELAREHADGNTGPRAVNRAVRRVSTALGNTPGVARASYIDPRVIRRFEGGTVVELPRELLTMADPVLTQSEPEGVVLELATDIREDKVRMDVEQRVYRLLRAA